ncbi:MAG: M55 family metallopeptidase [Lentisphaeria bacterium]|nr:M55 family metallopeptidase [Lentisphaeria bacterium]
MKIYIFADLEGISGVSNSSFVTADGAKYALGCRYITRDVNICAQACFDAGADAVTIRDGHGAGTSIQWHDLIPGVELMQGTAAGVRFPGIEGADAVILLGYHAMAGTTRALLEHSYSSKSIQNMWLNGKLIGEFGIDTLIAGEKGLPVIMTSGCDKLCKEAREFSPEVVTCQVKTSTHQQGCILLSPADAEKRLREKTFEAIQKFKEGRIKPLTVSPAVIRREYVERAEPAEGLVAPRTTEFSAKTVEDAYFGRQR